MLTCSYTYNYIMRSYGLCSCVYIVSSTCMILYILTHIIRRACFDIGALVPAILATPPSIPWSFDYASSLQDEAPAAEADCLTAGTGATDQNITHVRSGRMAHAQRACVVRLKQPCQDFMRLTIYSLVDDSVCTRLGWCIRRMLYERCTPMRLI